ncbi:MAG: molybdenum cofactor guanylyltransferase [Thermoplasmata archaeon]|nr:MAG: molybdenum cofactor guanylyltransferase [Thermoplasmata archaeon]
MKSAVILAGGKSTRMGIDKCIILFHGKPLIYWPYSILKNVTEELIISVSCNEETTPLKEYFGQNVEIVTDEIPDLGPISGILSSFTQVKGEYVALSPCDSPLIKSELYQRLFDKANGADGAVPLIGSYWEPLHGVYKKDAMLSAIKNILAEGKCRFQDTFKYLNIREFTEEDIKDIDPNLYSFVNINSFQDLTKASSIFIRTRNKK